MKEKGCYCLCCLTLKADQVTTDNGPNKRSWGKFVFCLFVCFENQTTLAAPSHFFLSLFLSFLSCWIIYTLITLEQVLWGEMPSH